MLKVGGTLAIRMRSTDICENYERRLVRYSRNYQCLNESGEWHSSVYASLGHTQRLIAERLFSSEKNHLLEKNFPFREKLFYLIKGGVERP
jgi:hypothetical protein